LAHRPLTKWWLALAVTAGTMAGLLPAAVADDQYRFDLRLEAGPAWQARNRVQIPNDQDGTRFSLSDLAGEGPWAGVRATALWDLTDRHGLRLVLAPFSYSENGRFVNAVEFAGASFGPGPDVEASYTFNSWRIGYRYQFHASPAWDLWVGATAKVRDAEIRLQQGTTDRL